MQLTNHFLLTFTTLSLYLKGTLLRPTCHASALWRDLISMSKRSLEKGEKLHHMQKQQGTGGALMEQRNPTPPSGTPTDQRHPNGTPKRNLDGTH